MEKFKNNCINLIDDESIAFENADAQILANILNNMGLIYFHSVGNNPLIFDNIGKFNDTIQKIMQYAKTNNDKGKFSFNELLADKDITNEKEIIQVLLDNSSIVKINEDEYLASQFLPQDPDVSIDFFLKTFTHCNVRYVYASYFHKSILLNLFKEFGAKNKNLPLWKNGIIVPFSDQMVLIEFSKRELEDDALISLKTTKEFDISKTDREQGITLFIENLNMGLEVKKEISTDSITYFDIEELEKNYVNLKYEFHENGRKFRLNDFKKYFNFKQQMPKRIFISYASVDRDHLKEFTLHLKPLQNQRLLETWDDRELQAGDNWDALIKENLEKSDAVILLITANFLNSEYIKNVELEKSIIGNKKIIPLLVDYCTWLYDETLSGIQVMQSKEPITSFNPRSRGWVEAIDKLKNILKTL